MEDERLLLQRFLKDGGLVDIIMASSAAEAFDCLGLGETDKMAEKIDLILLDIIMPKIDGIEVCRRIQGAEHLKDIPIIMVSVKDEVESIKMALDSGAIDYITKPVDKVELLARVQSGMRLKQEMDRRKARERALEERNQMLERLSFLDGLTGVANRRYFDESITQECRRAARDNTSLSLVMLDIDFFKRFNDTYGHQKGDVCLKEVATALSESLKRPGDFVARYGGEEFVAVLPNTDIEGAVFVAEAMRSNVAILAIPHANSEAGSCVTVSLGVGSMNPTHDTEPAQLISMVDKALYEAKGEGRNRLKKAHEIEED